MDMKRSHSLAKKSVAAFLIAAQAASASAQTTPEILGLTPAEVVKHHLPPVKEWAPSQLKYGLEALPYEKMAACIEAYTHATLHSNVSKDFKIEMPTETGTITCAKIVETSEDRKFLSGRDDGNRNNTYPGCW